MKEPGSVTKTFIRMWGLYQICYQMPFFSHAPVTALFLNVPRSKPLWIVWFRSSPPSLPPSLLLQSYSVLPFAWPSWGLFYVSLKYEAEILWRQIWYCQMWTVSIRMTCKGNKNHGFRLPLMWWTSASSEAEVALCLEIWNNGFTRMANFLRVIYFSLLPWCSHLAGITGEVGHEGMLH